MNDNARAEPPPKRRSTEPSGAHADDTSAAALQTAGAAPPAAAGRNRPAASGPGRSVRRYQLRWTLYQGRKARLATLSLIAVALAVVAFLIDSQNPSERALALEVVANPGTTDIALSSREPRLMSPGCGCRDPDWGEHNWFGMNLPAAGFEMSLKAPPLEGVRTGTWAFEAAVPSLNPIDWFAVPDHTVQMRVVAGDGPHRREVFNDRVMHMNIITTKRVTVEHGQRYPYAALLPAWRGRTRFTTTPSSRGQFGAAMDVETIVPQIGDAFDWFEIEDEATYLGRPDLFQRGAMVDLLGPTVRFSVERAGDLRLFAAAKRLQRFGGDEPVEVTLRTPFALRLYPHPVTQQWLTAKRAQWRETRREAEAGDREAQRVLRQGPLIQGRFVETSPLPSYTLHLGDLQTPSPASWRRFAQESAGRGEVEPMLSPAKAGGDWATIYQLPPVRETPEVGVFGPVTRLVTRELRGQVSVENSSTPLVRGRHVELTSRKGIATGRQQLTPLISSGQPTSEAYLSGLGAIKLDGELLGDSDNPFVVWLLLGIAGTLLGLAVTSALKWGWAGRTGADPSRSTTHRGLPATDS